MAMPGPAPATGPGPGPAAHVGTCKNSEPQAYWVSNSIRHGGGMKTTIPKNPAFDYTYANENILAKS